MGVKRERRGGEEWVGRVTVARQPILGSDSYSTPCTNRAFLSPFDTNNIAEGWLLLEQPHTHTPTHTVICDVCTCFSKEPGMLFWPHPHAGMWLQPAESDMSEKSPPWGAPVFPSQAELQVHLIYLLDALNRQTVLIWSASTALANSFATVRKQAPLSHVPLARSLVTPEERKWRKFSAFLTGRDNHPVSLTLE